MYICEQRKETVYAGLRVMTSFLKQKEMIFPKQKEMKVVKYMINEVFPISFQSS